MTWQAPEWLWVAAVAAVLIPLAAWAGSWRRRRQEAVATAGVWRRWLGGIPATGGLRMCLLALAALLASLGAARPRSPAAGLATEIPATVVVAVDVSRSMLAADVQPSRLARGLEVVRTALPETSPRVWAMVAGGPIPVTVVPLTPDRSAVLSALQRLHWPEELQSGTDLAALLTMAGSTVVAGSGRRIVVVVSDGEEWHGDGGGTADVLRAAGVKVLAVLAGTPEGAPVPAGGPGADAETGVAYLRLGDGAVAVTRARPEVMARIAGAAHEVVDARDHAAPTHLRKILDETLRGAAAERGEDLSPWLYLPAAIIASAGFLLWPWRRLLMTAGLAAVLVVAPACSHPPRFGDEIAWQQLRDRLVRQVQADPRNRGARLSWATAAALCGDVEGEAVLRSLAQDPEMASVAWFNLGTVKLLRGNPHEAISPLRKAVTKDPDAAEAWRNLELAHLILRSAPTQPGTSAAAAHTAEHLVRSAAEAALHDISPPLPPASNGTREGPSW